MDSRLRGPRDAGAGGRAGAASPAPAAGDAVRVVATARISLRDVGTAEIDDLAVQAADDALMSILRDARRLPRHEPLHDLGLQVRGPRGRREGPAQRVAASERSGDPQADDEVEGTP